MHIHITVTKPSIQLSLLLSSGLSPLKVLLSQFYQICVNGSNAVDSFTETNVTLE